MTRRIIDSLQATALRRAGGVYFVPKGKRDELARLREMVAGLPHLEDQPFVCAFGVPDLHEAKAQMTQALHAGMLDCIFRAMVNAESGPSAGFSVHDDRNLQKASSRTKSVAPHRRALKLIVFENCIETCEISENPQLGDGSTLETEQRRPQPLNWQSRCKIASEGGYMQTRESHLGERLLSFRNARKNLATVVGEGFAYRANIILERLAASHLSAKRPTKRKVFYE